MKTNIRRFTVLFSCLAATAAVASLSACSMLISAVEGEGGTGGGSSGGIAGSYTLDVAAMDADWASKVVDTALWSVTARTGAYATDTLLLNEDGTYELVKTQGADEYATDHWSQDGGVEDRNFLWYKYYGTYTASGSTVTLSQVTKIAIEVDVFNMSLEYGLGNNPVDYTETEDLEIDAGTCGDETVIDFFYGPYIADSGKGNCTQTVELGEYAYGTFTFVEEQEEPDDQPGGEVDTRPCYSFTPVDNQEITFSLYEDGTYTFAWAANDVSESGTYTWDRLTQTLTLTDPAGKEYTVKADENGGLAFTYYLSVQAQLFQDYTGTVAAMEEVICNVAYEMIPATDGDVSLKLYSDNTYTYADPENNVRETGTYEWDGAGALTLTTPAEKEIVSSIQDDLPNIVYINYTTDTSSQVFIGSLTGMQESVPSAAVIYTFVGLNNPVYTFELFDDFTYKFYDGQHGVTEYGVWSFSGKTLALNVPGSEATVIGEYSVSGDTLSFTYYYSVMDALNQPFECSLSELGVAIARAGIAKSVYTFTGLTNPLYTFTVYDSGAYLFYDGQHNISEYGVWTYDGETLALNVPGSEATVIGEYAVTDGTMSFTYYYSVMSALQQPFECDIAEFNMAIAKAGLSDAVYSFVGLTNDDYTFTLYKNGVYLFYDGQHGVSEYGIWSYNDGTLSLNVPGSEATVIGEYAVTDGTMSFTYYYSVMDALNQPFSCPVAEFEEALGITEGGEA